jgi:uncharacterized protein (DUF1697 family)
MKTLIALLRGINVVGRNSLSMKDLAADLASLGLRDVKTYIQSGNVVFRSAAKDTAALARKIGAEIERQRVIEPHVIVLNRNQLEKIIAANPFPEAEMEPSTLHVNFLSAKPLNPNLAKLEDVRTKTERFALKREALYLHAPDGIGRSKLAARIEKVLGVPVTSRNWRTVCKLAAMAKEIDG